MSVQGALRHFITISRHKHCVFVHCVRAGIPGRGLLHDCSKYAWTEFREGMRYFQGNRSPNEKTRELLGHSPAWLHHQGRNRHHFEYWHDYDPRVRRRVPVRMPFVFVLEMFCDRVAASKIYQKEKYTDQHPLAYFLSGEQVRSIHPETSRLLEGWLRLLAERGESETFRYLHHLHRQAKRGVDPYKLAPPVVFTPTTQTDSLHHS